MRGIGIGDTTASGRELRETPTRPHVSPPLQGRVTREARFGRSVPYLPVGLLGVAHTPTRPYADTPTRFPHVAGQGNAESPGSDGASPYLWANAHPPTRPTPIRRHFSAKGQGLSGRDDPVGEGAKHPSEICVRIL
jgi:hypothetical protein